MSNKFEIGTVIDIDDSVYLYSDGFKVYAGDEHGGPYSGFECLPHNGARIVITSYSTINASGVRDVATVYFARFIEGDSKEINGYLLEFTDMEGYYSYIPYDKMNVVGVRKKVTFWLDED